MVSSSELSSATMLSTDLLGLGSVLSSLLAAGGRKVNIIRA